MKKKTYIIAEAGVNHNGDMNLAKKLIDEAKNIGVDAIKFQTYITEKLVDKNGDKVDYQNANDSNSINQFDMLKRLEISYDNFRELKKYADNLGIDFLSTPFDVDSLYFLIDELNLTTIKIGSGDLNNYELLEAASKKAKRLIISTGMANIDEIDEAIKFIKDKNSQIDLSVLHCTTSYPANKESLNLKSITYMKDRFNLNVGYSDHSIGSLASIMAVTLGANIIEKHLTLDSTMKGPDHKASMEPDAFKKMVIGIRDAEIMLGAYQKQPTMDELKIKENIIRRIFLVKDLKEGTSIRKEDLAFKRGNNGISSKYINLYIGKKINCDLKKDDVLKEEYFE